VVVLDLHVVLMAPHEEVVLFILKTGVMNVVTVGTMLGNISIAVLFFKENKITLFFLRDCPRYSSRGRRR
jgi:hypothetical protein